jgi:hypothetical protein
VTARQGKLFLPRFAWRRTLAVVLAVAWLAGSCRADSLSLPDLRDLSLTNWDCLNKPEGAAHDAAHVSRNRMKNRDWIAVTATNIPQWDYAQFVEHAHAFDAELGATFRSSLTHEAAARLASIESRVVSVTGWMVLTYPGPPESCNCNSAEYHDWHIELLPRPLDHAPTIGDPTAIICEVTPRTEAPLYRAGVRLQKLAEFMNLGRPPNIVARPTGSPPHKVRITGYLMWDDQHNVAGADIGPTIERGGRGEYHHPWRVTAWEIHPILKIEDLGVAP